VLKRELSLYYDKVKDLQGKIEESDTFQSLVRNDVQDQGQIRLAAREAAMKAAEKEGVKHPPLPSWWQERLTYDWGDALVDDLMGNSADLTSSPNPFPRYMGKEYGRLRRKVERALRSIEIEKRLSLEDGERGLIGGKPQQKNVGDAMSLPMTSDPTSRLPSQSATEAKLSDELISDLLRSHRDFRGKRTTPIGLAPSLELLFEDLQIPRSSLGTFSYVSLLTCCKSPWEARKVNEMRQEDGVRSNGYFWSAMVDVYARSGDYRGAEMVLDEMLEETQAEYTAWKAAKKQNADVDEKSQQSEPPIAIPPLPAYTSFFSACYKLISRGDVHPSIKSDAGKRAWNRWKEMRIHSVAPDAMAYGAMMRVFAAQGRAEKALDMVEEIMSQMMVPVSAEGILNGNGNQLQENILRSLDGDEDGWYDDQDGNTVRVKPTTLLFTSALKAVAKSHEIAVRFSGGKSKNNRIRESITSYHGRLARKIVILAEQAEVDQDDGFVSALMLCAAAAGDSSTARAIYLASKVRRLDHLRTCGGKEHLKKLQGLIPQEEREMLCQGGDNALSLGGGRTSSSISTLRTVEEEYKEQHQAYELREYGKDTRILNTLLLSHAKAMEAKGLGSMWAGQFNRGYLCENSLRWIEAFNIPKMVNDAIPGISHTEAGLAAEGWQPEDFGDEKGSKQLRKNKKFSMKSIMDDGDQNLRDDLDPEFAGYDDETDEQSDGNFLQLVDGKDEVTRDWLSDDHLLSIDDPTHALDWNKEFRKLQSKPDETEDMRSTGIKDDFGFDSDDEDEHNQNKDSPDFDFDFELAMKRRDDLIKSMGDLSMNSESGNEMMLEGNEKIFDNEEDDLDQYMKEEEFLALMNEASKDSLAEGLDDELDTIPGLKSNDFATFCNNVKAELRSEGSLDKFNEAETRQLFDMMRTYYEDDNDSYSNNIPDAEFNERSTFSANFLNDDDVGFKSESFGRAVQNDEIKPQTQMAPTSNETGKMNQTIYADDYLEWASTQKAESSNNIEAESKEPSDAVAQVDPPAMGMSFQKEILSPAEKEALHITELQQLLPGLPRKRIEKISDEFSRVLGYPSILRLALVLRENMPDDLSPQWLVKKNLANARHIMAEAEKEGLVDIHLLNGMLQVEANSGRIEPAYRFHSTEFEKHGLVSLSATFSVLF